MEEAIQVDWIWMRLELSEISCPSCLKDPNLPIFRGKDLKTTIIFYPLVIWKRILFEIEELFLIF
jgi:hypothetical protein